MVRSRFWLPSRRSFLHIGGVFSRLLNLLASLRPPLVTKRFFGVSILAVAAAALPASAQVIPILQVVETAQSNTGVTQGLISGPGTNPIVTYTGELGAGFIQNFDGSTVTLDTSNSAWTAATGQGTNVVVISGTTDSSYAFRAGLVQLGDTSLLGATSTTFVLNSRESVGFSVTSGTNGTSWTFKYGTQVVDYSGRIGQTLTMQFGGSVQFVSTDHLFITSASGVTNDVTTQYFDPSSVSAVPEPSTYAAIVGACALGFVGWRRRKAEKRKYRKAEI